MANTKNYLDKTGLALVWQKIKNITISGVKVNGIDLTKDANDRTVSLTIQKNGTTITPDSSTKAINIEVPTKTSDLTNDGDGTAGSEFATKAYVDSAGGKIDTISLNGTNVPADTNKNVNINAVTSVNGQSVGANGSVTVNASQIGYTSSDNTFTADDVAEALDTLNTTSKGKQDQITLDGNNINSAWVTNHEGDTYDTITIGTDKELLTYSWWTNLIADFERGSYLFTISGNTVTGENDSSILSLWGAFGSWANGVYNCYFKDNYNRIYTPVIFEASTQPSVLPILISIKDGVEHKIEITGVDAQDNSRFTATYSSRDLNNVIESISINGTAQPVSNKNVELTIPEGAAASDATPLMDGTGAAGTSVAFARGDHVHPTDTTRAPIASPEFTGTPTTPTVAAGDDSTKIANTSFVNTAITNALAGFTGIDYQVVQTLPATGQKGIIYLVPYTNDPQSDTYDEYIWIDGDPSGRFELIGNTDIDLNGYLLEDAFITSSDINTICV